MGLYWDKGNSRFEGYVFQTYTQRYGAISSSEYLRNGI